MKFRITIIDRVRDLYIYRDEPERMHALADFYWRSLLVLFALMVIGSIFYGLWQLSAIFNPSASPDSSAAAPPPDVLHKNQLQTVLDAFTTRHAAYDTLRNNPPHVADPAR